LCEEDDGTGDQVTNFAGDKRFRLVDIGQRDLERNVTVDKETEIWGVVFPTVMEFLSKA
jgi:hypothetical protein